MTALAVVLLLAGGVLATVARPVRPVTATTSTGGSAPLTVVSPELLASRTGPVVVSARGQGQVLVAAGTADDVAAWVQGAATTTATRLQADGGIATASATGEEQVPDPAGSDLWSDEATGTGRAELTVDPAGGTSAVLVASDGTSPAPSALQLTWTHRPVPLAAWGLLGLGALLLGVLAAGRRSRRPRAPGNSEGPAPDVIDLRDGHPTAADPALATPLVTPQVRPRGRRRSRR